jgi:hypothetical protein
VGSYVQPVHAAPTIIMVRGFPPPEPGPARRPLAGYVLRPTDAVHVVIGLAVSAAGRHTFTGVRLWYRGGSTRYATEFPLSGTLCAPRRAPCAPSES